MEISLTDRARPTTAAGRLLAAGQDAIMVVLGARGRDGFDALRLGSVTPAGAAPRHRRGADRPTPDDPGGSRTNGSPTEGLRL